MSSYRERYNEALKVLSDKMDKIDKFRAELLKWFLKYGSVPEQYKEAYLQAKKDRFQPWRHQPKVRKRVVKAAKKAAKAKGLEKLTEEAREKAFKEMLK